MSSVEAVKAMPANKLVNLYMMCSYLYYIHDLSPVPDEVYDEICKQLILKYQDIDHQHGHLINKDALHAGTAYHLREVNYPLIVQVSALAWMDKGSPIAPIKTRRRRINPEPEPVETPPARRRVRRRR